MGIALKTFECLQMKDGGKFPESIIKGDTVDLELYRRGVGLKHIVCIVEDFNEKELKYWDAETGENAVAEISAVNSFKVLIRGPRAYEMFGVMNRAMTQQL